MSRRLRDLLAIESHEDFHEYLFRHAVERYRVRTGLAANDLGSVLAIGANYREALTLTDFGFRRIALTGISDPDERIRRVIETDERVTYQRENSENLATASRSHDLVLCKESLHHLARPVMGLYEMLRICRKGIIVIEPYDTLAGRCFETLGVTTVYERSQRGNLESRDNFVYRWTLRSLTHILNSYYLESGYQLEITLGWMTSRLNAHPVSAIRRIAALVGWLLGYIPGSRGNYMTAIVLPGTDLPPDPPGC